jgi:site-specific recombinase XerD
MEGEIVHHPQGGGLTVPAIIADAGEGAAERFIEFFTANIRNPNTRAAYAQSVAQFLRWCQGRGFSLQDIKPVAVAAYIESHPGADPTKKQHLAAIKMLFDWLNSVAKFRDAPGHATFVRAKAPRLIRCRRNAGEIRPSGRHGVN